jgi:short-subunit dehydrogenase
MPLAITADLTRLKISEHGQVTLDRFGQIDILFNNAGAGRLDWLENLDPVKGIDEQLRLNLVALIQTCREVLPHMIARRSGHIINMASVAGLVATPTYSVYAASKFGVRGFSEALRREVKIYGIQVSAISGSVASEFTEHAGINRKTGR